MPMAITNRNYLTVYYTCIAITTSLIAVTLLLTLMSIILVILLRYKSVKKEKNFKKWYTNSWQYI